ncbi:MAG: hypothetical protein F9K29_06315 [Hyphomicrobiaceae bacterium]|nr:MAG: hypothetical protein F9K29_06315 [Hyphomicrobiaceae bacterium]
MTSDEPSRAPPAEPHEDAAWVRIATPLSPEQLRAFLSDVERLYHINPLLEISAFERAGRDRHRLIAHNHSNGQAINVVLAVAERGPTLEIAYSQGLKVATHFRAEPKPHGADLVVTDIYGGGSPEERHARSSEVDLSLNAWGRALHDYLKAWARWSWLPPWRWYMQRVWQPMKPSARRIVWMIWIISAFEVVALAALLAIWAALRQASP